MAEPKPPAAVAYTENQPETPLLVGNWRSLSVDSPGLFIFAPVCSYVRRHFVIIRFNLFFLSFTAMHILASRSATTPADQNVSYDCNFPHPFFCTALIEFLVQIPASAAKRSEQCCKHPRS